MNIVITGASRGIGFELAKVLAKHKQNHLVVISRNGKNLRELARECVRLYPEAKVTPYEFDLNQFEFYPFIVQRLETFIPKCDILVHNAGKLVNKPFSQFEQTEFDDTFNVNVKGPFFFTQAMLPMSVAPMVPTPVMVGTRAETSILPRVTRSTEIAIAKTVIVPTQNLRLCTSR